MGKSGKKLIAKFMGLTFVTVGYTGTDDETDWQRENVEWFDSHYEFHDHSVGDYAVNIRKNIILWQDDLRYKTSWDCLMPVMRKIHKLKPKNDFFIHITILNAKIDVVYKAVVEFIKWYNLQSK